MADEDPPPTYKTSSAPELPEVRAEIDAIDTQLVELLARRVRAVMSAVPAKRGQPEAEAQRRRQEVLHRVGELAETYETPFGDRFATFVQALFETVTTRSMDLQHEIGGLRYDESHGVVDARPDRAPRSASDD